MTAQHEPFGTIDEGQTVVRSKLTNQSGNHISVMNWGASLLEVVTPDRDGNRVNVNAVYDSLDRYLKPHPGFGSSIGRFCNRIALGRFTVDEVDYQVTVNHGKHCLHGGKTNWSRVFWQTIQQSDDSITYQYVSPDGDEGFPGEVVATASYRWSDDNVLTITYTATTTKPTHVNLTNHSYWNLSGMGAGSVRDHVALIHANQFLEVDDALIPTGSLSEVSGTPLDFQHPATFGQSIDQLPATKGYDHCYVVAGFSEENAGQLRPAALVEDPKSGRTLEIETTQPGMQLYTGNHLGRNERSAGLGSHDAFCLETQHYPDAPNHAHFPSTLLRPGQTMREVTTHRFGIV
ncbi:MAG: aldose epimerase family protein [Planctomycetota bacterium]